MSVNHTRCIRSNRLTYARHPCSNLRYLSKDEALVNSCSEKKCLRAGLYAMPLTKSGKRYEVLVCDAHRDLLAITIKSTNHLISK